MFVLKILQCSDALCLRKHTCLYEMEKETVFGFFKMTQYSRFTK